jgi:hypothetical protein
MEGCSDVTTWLERPTAQKRMYQKVTASNTVWLRVARNSTIIPGPVQRGGLRTRGLHDLNATFRRSCQTASLLFLLPGGSKDATPGLPGRQPCPPYPDHLTRASGTAHAPALFTNTQMRV